MYLSMNKLLSVVKQFKNIFKYMYIEILLYHHFVNDLIVDLCFQVKNQMYNSFHLNLVLKSLNKLHVYRSNQHYSRYQVFKKYPISSDIGRIFQPEKLLAFTEKDRTLQCISLHTQRQVCVLLTTFSTLIFFIEYQRNKH